MIDVAIIGAGPYGLSIASHLKARGVEFRIFGSPMRTWLVNMPKGMRVKSEGFASSLYDPESAFTYNSTATREGLLTLTKGFRFPWKRLRPMDWNFSEGWYPAWKQACLGRGSIFR